MIVSTRSIYQWPWIACGRTVRRPGVARQTLSSGVKCQSRAKPKRGVFASRTCPRTNQARRCRDASSAGGIADSELKAADHLIDRATVIDGNGAAVLAAGISHEGTAIHSSRIIDPAVFLGFMRPINLVAGSDGPAGFGREPRLSVWIRIPIFADLTI
ncbi:unnamed protein product, partial [Iphiclides podalirius]